MKGIQLGKLSDEELVKRFAVAAERTGEAVVNWLPPARLKKHLLLLGDVLRKRGQTSRLKLAPLLDHTNRFVRYYTAQELMLVLPSQCRPIIVENTKEFDAISGDARHFLRSVDEGKLTES